MSKASQRREAERQKRLRAGKASDSDLNAVLSRKGGTLFYENPVKYWTLAGQRGPKFKPHPDDDRLLACLNLLKPPLMAVMSSLVSDNDGIAPSLAPSLALTFDFNDLLGQPDEADEDEIPLLSSAPANAAASALSTIGVTSIWTLGRDDEVSDSPMDWLLQEAERCDTDVLVWALGIDHPSPFQLVLGVTKQGAKKAIANVQGSWVDMRPESVKRVLETHLSMGEASESDEYLEIEELRECLETPQGEPFDMYWSVLRNLVETAQAQGAQATWALACQYVNQRQIDISRYDTLKADHSRLVRAIEGHVGQAAIAVHRIQELEAQVLRERARVADSQAAPRAPTKATPSCARPTPDHPRSTIGERMSAIFN